MSLVHYYILKNKSIDHFVSFIHDNGGIIIKHIIDYFLNSLLVGTFCFPRNMMNYLILFIKHNIDGWKNKLSTGLIHYTIFNK